MNTLDNQLDLGRTHLRFTQAWKAYIRTGGPGVAPPQYVENVTAATIDLDQTYARHGFDPEHVLEIKVKAIDHAKAHLY